MGNIRITLADLIAVLAVFISMAVWQVFNGVILSIMWGWFIVPVFHLPQLSIAQAIGISLIVSILANQAGDNNKEKNKEKNSQSSSDWLLLIIPLLQRLIPLFVGYIVHLFM